MKESALWIQSVLKILLSQFPSGVPNVSLPGKEDDSSILIFSFRNKKDWMGFGVTEDDLKLTPEDLVSQVKDDLKL